MKHTQSFKPEWDAPIPDRTDANELVGFFAGLMVLGLAFVVLWTVL